MTRLGLEAVVHRRPMLPDSVIFRNQTVKITLLVEIRVDSSAGIV